MNGKWCTCWVRWHFSSPNPRHHDGAAPAPSVDGVVGSLNKEV